MDLAISRPIVTTVIAAAPLQLFGTHAPCHTRMPNGGGPCHQMAAAIGTVANDASL
jgi:hypothetical protein